MKIAIISGASSGIGRAIATELDALGLDELWLIGRRVKEIRAEFKSSVRCFAVDLKENNSFDEIKDALACGQYTVEYLVNSAGVGYTGRFDTLSADKIADTVDLNCRALSLLTSTVMPYLGVGSKIINIASGAGFLPQPDFSVYAASKAYVISLSRALRQELRSKKIKVTSVCPGPVDTEFFANLENVKEYKKKYLISPKRVAVGAIRAVNKNKAVYSPTLSIKLIHFASKILPTGLLLRFCK